VSADIKKVVEFPKPEAVVTKKKKVPKRRYAARDIDRLSDDELLEALENGTINPDELD
jgi:hypothetical protein